MRLQGRNIHHIAIMLDTNVKVPTILHVSGKGKLSEIEPFNLDYQQRTKAVYRHVTKWR